MGSRIVRNLLRGVNFNRGSFRLCLGKANGPVKKNKCACHWCWRKGLQNGPGVINSSYRLGED